MTGADDKMDELAARAAAGNAPALKLLLTASRDRLCEDMAGRVPADLRGVLDVDDVVQEAHIEAFRRIAKFEPKGPESFYRWVSAIALSRLRNAIKQQRADKRGGGWRAAEFRTRQVQDSTIALLDKLAGPDRTPSHYAARTEAVRAVQAAMADLPEQYRDALWLVHFEGQPIRAAAASMGRSPRAVHGLCRRGLDLLRERLQSATKFLSFGG
jgi:RNA polymerase sigma factor (sigma-70 family)